MHDEKPSVLGSQDKPASLTHESNVVKRFFSKLPFRDLTTCFVPEADSSQCSRTPSVCYLVNCQSTRTDRGGYAKLL